MSSHPGSPPLIAGFSYVQPLGSGGFADVFKYEQDMPRRVVAVKAIKRELTDAGDRSAFEAEADAMARLSSHPSIASIFAAGVSSDGRPYLTMELCPQSFRDRLRHGGPIPLPEVLDAGVRLAGALETAHGAGVLHRDIKPANVLIATTGRPVLADFGIVSLRGQMFGEKTSQAMSIPWAAPEVIGGETSGTVASEIWSLAATLYNLAAGRAPFSDPNREKNTEASVKSRIRRAPYTPVPGAQGYGYFDAVIARGLSKRPDERFLSMREFGEALRQAQRQYGLDATPLDVIGAAYVPAAPQPYLAPRGPVVSTVQGEAGKIGRAQRRAEFAAQQVDDLVQSSRSRGGALKPVLIGVGAAVVVLGIAVGIAVVSGVL